MAKSEDALMRETRSSVYNEGLMGELAQYYPNLGKEELNELIETLNAELWDVGGHGGEKYKWSPGESDITRGKRFLYPPYRQSVHEGVEGMTDRDLITLLSKKSFEGPSDNPEFDLSMRNLLENIAFSRGAQSTEVTVPTYGSTGYGGGYGQTGTRTNLETYIPPIEGNPFTGAGPGHYGATMEGYSDIVPDRVQAGRLSRGEEGWQVHEQAYPFNIAASVPYPEDRENAHSYIDSLISQQGGVSTEETASLVNLLDLIKESQQ